MRELLAPKEKPPYLKVQIESDAKTSRKCHPSSLPRCLLFLHYIQGKGLHFYMKG